MSDTPYGTVSGIHGVVERGIGSAPDDVVSEVALDKAEDMLRVDGRTQRVVVLSGEVALLCTRVDSPRLTSTRPGDRRANQVDLGTRGVEIAPAMSVEKDGAQLWVPQGPALVRFMGKARTSRYSRDVPFDQYLEFGMRMPTLDSDPAEDLRFARVMKQPEDFGNIPAAEAYLLEGATSMSDGVMARITYAAGSGNIAITNASTASAQSDIRVVAAS